jgi:tetratricopeptide (TPR) repeat protein
LPEGTGMKTRAIGRLTKKMTTMSKQKEPKSNLPSLPAMFVGREREIAQIERALADPDINVISVYGAGGTGKTVLARLVAERQRKGDRFPGGIVWIDCRVDDSLPAVLKTIAQTLSLDATLPSPASLRDAVMRQLRSIPTLLIFDAYEVVAQDDEVLSFIARLPRMTKTKAIIVSRERTRVSGKEIIIRLDSLSEIDTLEMLQQLLGPEQWKKLDPEVIRSIIRLTGGLPLAIALVTDLAKQELPFPKIITQLQYGVVPTDKVIEHILQQAETTLSEQEREALEALSIFAHPVEVEAIVAVSGIVEWSVLARRLAQRALVEVVGTRYALHPIVRTFFRRHIQHTAPDRLAMLERQMVEYFLEYTRKFQKDYDRLEQEWLNIQYALERAYQNEFLQELVAIVSTIRRFLHSDGYESEQQMWLNRAFEASKALGDQQGMAMMANSLGKALQSTGRLDEAIATYRHGLETLEAPRNPQGTAMMTNSLGKALQSTGRLDEAIATYRHGLETLEALRDPQGTAMMANSLGKALQSTGRLDEAINTYRHGLTTLEALNDPQGIAMMANNLGKALQETERFDEAITTYRHGLATLEALGNPQGTIMMVNNLGKVLQRTGRLEEAITTYRHGWVILEALGNPQGIAMMVNNLGKVLQRTGRLEEAITTYRHGLATLEALDDPQGIAMMTNNLGEALQRTERFEEAITTYRRSLATLEALNDPQGIAMMATNLGKVLQRTGRLKEAIATYRHGWVILEALGNPQGTAIVLNSLGSVLQRTGRWDEAIAALERSLAIAQKLRDRRQAAIVLNSLGSVLQRTGRWDEAVATLERGLAIAQELGDERQAAIVLNNLSTVLERAGHLDEAVATLERSLAIAQELGDQRQAAMVLSNWGTVLHAMGQTDRAIVALEQAQPTLSREAFPREWLSLSAELSTLYAEVGDWNRAKQLATSVLQLFRGTVADEEVLEALVPWYQRLGVLAIQSQDSEFATRIFAETAYRFEFQGIKVPDPISSKLAELREQIGDDRFAIIWAEVQGILTPVLAQTLQDAVELMKQEQFSKAVAKFTSALELLPDDDKSPEVQRHRAVILSMRGICLRRQEQLEEALKDQEQALHLFESVRDFGGEARSLLEMGYLLELMNNYEDARLHYMDAYRLYRRAGDRHGMATASEHLGRLEFRVRMPPQAVEDLEEARDLWEQLGEHGRVAAIKADLEDARAMLAHQAAKAEK